PVRGAEVDSPFEYLADAAAAADRLVVDLYVGLALVELVEPLRVDRVGERRAGAVDEYGGVQRCAGCEGQHRRQWDEPTESLSRHSASFAFPGPDFLDVARYQGIVAEMLRNGEQGATQGMLRRPNVTFV